MSLQPPASPYPVPVLFIIFNRADTTSRVWQAIQQVKPARLFIAADGPRKHKEGEAEKCAATRAITETIDWPCEVKRLYREENLGCRKAVSGALDWFFSEVEEGVILEDDCLPVPDFWPFMQEMLTRYRNEERIGMVCGSNFQDGRPIGTGDYYFSWLYHVWGWGSWRRAWKDYDVEMRDWPALRDSGRIMQRFLSQKAYKHLNLQLDLTHAGKIDTWDYQFVFSQLKTDRMSVIPNANLIDNIGFGPEATHTFIVDMPVAYRPVGSLNGLKAPAALAPEMKADRYTYLTYDAVPSIPVRAINKLRRWLGMRPIPYLFPPAR